MALRIKTDKTTAIKTLFETLKELLTEATLVATAAGLSLEQMDASQSCYIKLVLAADKFTTYECDPKVSYIITINTRYVYVPLQTLKAEDILLIEMESRDATNLKLTIVNVDGNAYDFSTSIIATTHDVHIPKTVIENEVFLTSHDFAQAIQRAKHGSCEHLQISLDDKAIQFSSKTHIGWSNSRVHAAPVAEEDGVVTATARRGPANVDVNSPYYQCETYLFNYLSAIVKATPMSPFVSVSILSDRKNALLVRFSVGDYGTFDVYLAAYNDPEKPESARVVAKPPSKRVREEDSPPPSTKKARPVSETPSPPTVSAPYRMKQTKGKAPAAVPSDDEDDEMEAEEEEEEEEDEDDEEEAEEDDGDDE